MKVIRVEITERVKIEIIGRIIILSNQPCLVEALRLRVRGPRSSYRTESKTGTPLLQLWKGGPRVETMSDPVCEILPHMR